MPPRCVVSINSSHKVPGLTRPAVTNTWNACMCLKECGSYCTPYKEADVHYILACDNELFHHYYIKKQGDSGQINRPIQLWLSMHTILYQITLTCLYISWSTETPPNLYWYHNHFTLTIITMSASMDHDAPRWAKNCVLYCKLPYICSFHICELWKRYWPCQLQSINQSINQSILDMSPRQEFVLTYLIPCHV